MMKTAIIDYGMGNLYSIYKSVQTAAERNEKPMQIILTQDVQIIRSADKVIFPGQGAMRDCMAALNQSGLREAVEDALRNKHFFGVCVGAQLLFEHSEEGNTEGLAWFQGRVKRFVNHLKDEQGERLKVPHMGWNTVRQTQAHPLFEGIANPEYFYFVHSYHFEPKESSITLGECDYPTPFSCIVGKDNVFATQFHTEISHNAGLRLLQNFLNWKP